MIEIQVFRENPDLIKNSQRQRGEPIKIVDEVIDFDNKWRRTLKSVEQLNYKRNQTTLEISKLKKQGKSGATKIRDMRILGEEIQKKQALANRYLQKRDEVRERVGNILDKSVPFGKSDADNKVLRNVGRPPKFNFKGKSHAELCENLGVIDFERAAKVAGSGFFYLKGRLTILDHALQRFALDFLMKKGYTPIFPPLMMNRKAYSGVTDMESFETVMYKMDRENLYLIATSEHPMGAMYMNETFKKKELPIKLCGISPCFRREIGTHGKFTKGLFRVHNFMKVEQFIFSNREDSCKYHEELQKNAEELYKALEIPYRVVAVCTGDLGPIASKKYDIEAWMADGKYREVGSNSNCTTYQATRLNVKYIDDDGQKKFVHTLNNTALATSRTLISLIESHQTKDGKIKIPKALWRYTGFKEIA